MKREALVVGINEYPFFHLNEKDLKDYNLKAPENDALEVTNLLKEYGGFKVSLLPNKLQQHENYLGRKLAESASINPEDYVWEEELRTKLEQLFNPPDNEFPNVALFYFAGHGYYNEKTGEYFLAAADTAPLKQKYGLSLDWLREQLKKSRVKQQVVWLDCCFSGGLFNDFEIESDRVDRCLITASRSFELAIEEEHGLLTEKLLKWLNPEDKLNPWVKNYDLEEWIKRENFPPDHSPLCRNGGNKSIILTSRQSLIAVDPRLEGKCPYLSLNYFNVEDAVFFYGRKQLTLDLVKRVEHHNLIAVLGASGSGKSSLLRAGLLYELKRGQETGGSDRWLYVEPFTPGEDPVKSLSAAEEKLKTADRRMVMIIDQFEECFTMCQDESKRQEFFKCLLAMLEQKGNRLCIVIGMRSDFRARLSEYREFAKKIDQQYVYITDLNSEEIEEAIVEPAKQVGLQVEKSLVERIKADVKGYPNSLPLLQYTLYEMWREEGNSGFLKQETYDRLGGIEETLKKSADTVFKGLPEQDQKVAQRIFLELTQIGGTANTRRRIHLHELVNSHHSLELLQQVSDKLAARNARLITKNSEKDSVVLDVVHEALIGQWIQLQEWKNEYRNAIVIERKIEAAAKDWEKARKPDDTGLLLQGTRLAEAEGYLKEYGDLGMLDGVAEEYIQKSQELRDRQEKEKQARKRTLYLIGGFVSVLITGFAIFAGDRWRKSEIQQIRALTESSKAFTLSNQPLDAGMASLQAAKTLKSSLWQPILPEAELKNQVLDALVQTSYGGESLLREYNRLKGDGRPVQWSRDLIGWSPDGKILAFASADNDNTVKLWKPDGTLQILKGHPHPVVGVSWNRNSILATVDGEGTVILWDRDGNQKGRFNLPPGRGWLYGVSWSPDGKSLAFPAQNGNVYVWRHNGEPLWNILPGHGSAFAVGWSPDGTLATGGNRTLKLWRHDQPEPQALFDPGWVIGVSWSPDGKILASVTDLNNQENIVKLYQNGKLLPLEHPHKVMSVSWSRDGILASGSVDKTIRLWKPDGTLLTTLRAYGSVSSLSWSPDGKILAAESKDGTVQLWRANPLVTSLVHPDRVNSISWSHDGQLLASGSKDGKIRLWRKDGTPDTTVDSNRGEVKSVSWSPGGILASAGHESVQLWTRDGKHFKLLDHAQHRRWSYPNPVKQVSWSFDGNLLASASWDATVQLWDRNGIWQKTLEHDNWVEGVSWSRKQLLASAGKDGKIKIFKPDSTKPITVDRKSSAVLSVSWSPDGQILASAHNDNTVRLWDENGTFRKELRGHEDDVRSVSWSPTRQILASASADGTVKLWKQDGILLITLKAHTSAVNQVSWSPDGRFLATASDDKTAKLWRLDVNLEDDERLLEDLLTNSCDWVHDYLNNPEGKENKDLCNGIGAKSDNE